MILDVWLPPSYPDFDCLDTCVSALCCTAQSRGNQDMFKKLFKAIGNFFRADIPPLTPRDVIYLEQACRQVDLERRIKELEYRASHARRLCY